MWKWLGLFSLVGLIIFGFYLYSHLGIDQPVTIEIGERGPHITVFKEHRGPYHLIAPVISEVEKWALSQNLACSQTFGRYLDDPESVDEDRLRSEGGCILTGEPSTPIPNDYKLAVRPRKKYVIAHFQGSPAIGPYKVYPKVRQFLEQNRLKAATEALEIYTVNGAQVSTEYLFEIP